MNQDQNRETILALLKPENKDRFLRDFSIAKSLIRQARPDWTLIPVWQDIVLAMMLADEFDRNGATGGVDTDELRRVSQLALEIGLEKAHEELEKIQWGMMN